MASLTEEQGTKRKRVFKACDTCRSMKSKCDGARPACSRCTGYGYKCAYTVLGKRGHNHQRQALSVSHDSTETTLRLAVADYDKLVRSLLPQLSDASRAGAEDARQRLDERVQAALQGAPPSSSHSPTTSATPAPISLPRNSPSTQRAAAERYLGEVSDVRFFNLVDRALAERVHPLSPSADHPGMPRSAGGDHGDLGDGIPADHHEAADGEVEPLESYEQEDPSPEEAAAHHGTPVEFPGADTAERYMDIYFSTIHIAYPFLPRALFRKAYHQFLASGRRETAGDTWLATLYILFAIGAYYDSVSGGTAAENALHEQYYRRALALSGTDALERSLGEVSFLLAQCFYLLAVCRTDKCWTTLGLAVRIAQSIGLHVDVSESSPPAPRAELRRRVWYSVYVLDRLLALQLGRPPAIHDEDCHLRLPSRLGDADIDWDRSDFGFGFDAAASDPARPAPSVGDYFVCLISLSKIIGHVLRDLYSPRATGSLNLNLSEWLLPSTKRLDGQLLEWRRALPRSLRFDFGHTFETSVVFKRQRNMLAIKFHHLRALVHRPYLCLLLLQRQAGGLDQPQFQSQTLPQSTDSSMVDRYEQVCIAEAQETAHLLHNVVDKRDLVHGFPWWQMISCLICASSILVVASAFARRSLLSGAGGAEDEDVDTAALEDDAETCLKVFEALSPSSQGARIARDMMRRLKARGGAWREAHLALASQVSLPAAADGMAAPVSASALLPELQGPVAAQEQTDTPMTADRSMIYDAGLPFLQEWPLEILDSMAWSTQFFDTADSSQQGYSL